MDHQQTISHALFEKIVSGQKKSWLASDKVSWNQGDRIAFVQANASHTGITGYVYHSTVSYIKPLSSVGNDTGFLILGLDPHQPAQADTVPIPCPCSTARPKKSQQTKQRKSK